MVILGEKGRCIAPMDILIREAAYDNVRDQTVLPLHKIKTFKREIKRWRMLHTNNTPDEDYGYSLKP